MERHGQLLRNEREAREQDTQTEVLRLRREVRKATSSRNSCSCITNFTERAQDSAESPAAHKPRQPLSHGRHDVQLLWAPRASGQHPGVPRHQKVAGSIHGQGTYPGCSFDPVGARAGGK